MYIIALGSKVLVKHFFSNLKSIMTFGLFSATNLSEFAMALTLHGPLVKERRRGTWNMY